MGVVHDMAAQERQVTSSPPAGSRRGPPTDAGWLDQRQQGAWRAVQVMQARLSAALAGQLAADSDLSLADYAVLVGLTDKPGSAARVHDLARHLGWERSRVSHHVARMEARALVSKERCAEDRRGSFVVVTERGRRAIEAAAPGHVAAVRRFFIDALTGEQLDALADAAARVVEAIDRVEAMQADGAR